MTIHIKTKPKLPFENWKIESHTPVGKINLEKLILHLEPEQENGYLKGEVLRERLKDKHCLDGAVLDYLLAHTELIPESWKGKYVYFWGTIYRDSGGDLYVRYLYWVGGRWDWDYYWLDLVWRSDNPAAVSQVSTGTSEPKNSLSTKTLDADAVEINHEQRIKSLEEKVERITKWAQQIAPPEL